MAVVEQVRFSIFSQQEIQQVQNEVIELEDLAERKGIAEEKIQQSQLSKRGGIFAPNELDATLPAAITKKQGNSLISRADESKLANSTKSTDKTSAAPFERGNAFKKALEEIKKLKEEQKKIKEEQKKAKKAQLQSKKDQLEAQAKTNDALGLVNDFQGTIFTKAMGAASKILPVGFALSIATTVFGMIEAQYGKGGIFDRRKKELDSARSLIGLERETDIIGGATLFLGNVTLTQGIPKNTTSNTENLRDGQRRYVLRNNGF